MPAVRLCPEDLCDARSSSLSLRLCSSDSSLSLGWRAVYLLGGASAFLLFFGLLGRRENGRFLRESFPTELRGDSFAWANSLLGRLGFVLAPLLVAELVAPLGWGHALSLTAAFPLLALFLIWLWLPETAGKELEEAAKLPR